LLVGLSSGEGVHDGQSSVLSPFPFLETESPSLASPPSRSTALCSEVDPPRITAQKSRSDEPRKYPCTCGLRGPMSLQSAVCCYWLASFIRERGAGCLDNLDQKLRFILQGFSENTVQGDRSLYSNFTASVFPANEHILKYRVSCVLTAGSSPSLTSVKIEAKMNGVAGFYLSNSLT
jgi:hypothetical protein